MRQDNASSTVPSAKVRARGEAAAVEDLMNILKHMATNIIYMGDCGTGQVTKICNQVMVMTTMISMAEMIKLAEKGGVASQSLPEIFEILFYPNANTAAY